jgi:uncharacterized protein YprB with RNaseH-like and TPR domain
MLSEAVRTRLAALNRTPLAEPKARESELPGPTQPDEQRLPKGQVVTTLWGTHWLIQQPLDKLWPNGHQSIRMAQQHHEPIHDDSDEDLMHLCRAFPNKTIFLDLETCGFAGSIIFLAGVLHTDGQGQLTLSQLWARDYSEEKSLLQSLWVLVGRSDLLVTFNGKSFDWPQVQDRSTRHHLGIERRDPPRRPSPLFEPTALTPQSDRPAIRHFDLLHHARRRWKRQLPNCKLQTLERYICGRHRNGDIPGRKIPMAYHQYVRDKDTRQVSSILHHNAMDLVTLLQLTVTFVQSP